jgi:hypothetical protein
MSTNFTDAGIDCSSDSQGRFGSSAGEVSNEVQYEYELETKPNVDANVISYIILPKIERLVSDVLVTVVFENCGKRRQLQGYGLTGLTSAPPDMVSMDPCKGALTDESNKCVVMVGVATVFSREAAGEGVLEAAQGMVRQALDNGEFNGIHEGVVGVQYHNVGVSSAASSDPLPTPVPSGAPAPDVPADDSSDGYIWGIVAAAAFCGVVAVAFLVRRRVKRKRHKHVGELGIRPLTPLDLETRFDEGTRSSWDVLKHSTSRPREKQELGMSARELVDSPSEFDRSTRSFWDVLAQSPPTSPTKTELLGISNRSLEEAVDFGVGISTRGLDETAYFDSPSLYDCVKNTRSIS